MDGGHNAAAPSTVINSGSITAQGNTSGGQVELLGDQVAVSDGGRVNVSGGTGGGEVVINSDQQTTIEQGALISADALGSGNGGSVSVLSSGTTEFYGSISAVGAGSAGVGGSAEVSGSQLYLTGHADLTAANGTAGTLLLDPGSVTINHSSTSGGAQENTFGDSWISTQLGSSAVNISTANSTDDGSQDLIVNGTFDSGAQPPSLGTAATP